MNLDNFNNLIELFFYQVEKQKSENIFLEWLNPNDKKIFTWEETKQNIFKLSKKLKETVKLVKNLLGIVVLGLLIIL